MLQDGYGKLLEIAPISKHNKEFEKAEEFAQDHSLGIWSLD
jgi:endonuclease YncB( thermonuclease family)